ncbi:MAG: hypothetical protein AAF358_17555 [Pseudomonadota bacterium]
MSGSSQPPLKNSLYNVASVYGGLLGVFLIAGAFGHFAAIWPTVIDGQGSDRLVGLFFPGVLLLATGLLNSGSCIAFWAGKRRWLPTVLLVNTVATIYLGYLLWQGVVPNHPIGLFLALVSSYLVLLGTLWSGLTWPAPATSGTGGE